MKQSKHDLQDTNDLPLYLREVMQQKVKIPSYETNLDIIDPVY